MRVLVVGSRGMLGTDLMREFSAHGETVGLDLPELDISQPGQCRSALRDTQPDVVVNAAALTDVDYCENHAEEAFRVNAHGVGILAESVAAAGGLLVHYSTDYIFDGRKEAAYVEEDPANPLSVYGRSKLKGEVLLRALCPGHLLLRTSWLFGPQGKNFIRTIVAAAHDGGPLRVVHDQRGSPSYTRDVAAQTRLLVEAGRRGTYHVTNSGWCTWYELALRAIAGAGLHNVAVAPVRTVEFPRPAPRPPNSILANARLVAEGWEPLRAWTAAVEEYVRVFLSA
jgi:dTDP-4-dehydrorhamnose reductase